MPSLQPTYRIIRCVFSAGHTGGKAGPTFLFSAPIVAFHRLACSGWMIYYLSAKLIGRGTTSASWFCVSPPLIGQEMRHHFTVLSTFRNGIPSCSTCLQEGIEVTITTKDAFHFITVWLLKLIKTLCCFSWSFALTDELLTTGDAEWANPSCWKPRKGKVRYWAMIVFLTFQNV